MQKDINLKVIIYITLAFVFGIASRYYWIYWAGGIEPFIYNGSIMINTNDGYYFAEGASDIISNYNEPIFHDPKKEGLAIITALIYKITPFSLDTIMLYLSGIFSSLLVIPIIMISKELKCLEAGFVGSLVSVVAMSYYNRTMFGYYDTDMLVIVLPMFILWGMIKVTNTQKKSDIIIAPLFTLLYFCWYSASLSLNMALVFMFVFYTIAFDRKSLVNYQTIILMLVATTNLNILINLFLVLALYILFLKQINKKYFLFISILVILNFIINGGLNNVFYKIALYVFRDSSNIDQSDFVFFNVSKTISEAGLIDLSLFMKRISSHELLFVLSLIGYIIMCFKNRVFLLSLPMVGLGFLALKGGLRFTIYAVPIMGLGLGFLYFYILGFLNINRHIKMFVLSIITIISLVPALQHIYDYKMSTVFYNNEVKILDNFKNQSKRDDYFLAWWDYGYPLRYYTNAKTLIDGGIHSGEVNFPTSFALTKDQTSSANMARLAVEYNKKRINLQDEINKSTSFEKKFKKKLYSLINLKDKNNIPDQNLKWMMQDYGFNNVNDFLLNLSIKDFKLPPKTSDIYYYLPRRMMNIFSTITMFSDIDLTTGKSKDSQIFNITEIVDRTKEGFILDNGLFLSNDLKVLITNNKDIIKVKNFYETGYLEDGTLNMQEHIISKDGFLNVIFLANENVIILVDNDLINSTFVQLFFLQNYDKELFEPVVLDRYIKIYKLKR